MTKVQTNGLTELLSQANHTVVEKETVAIQDFFETCLSEIKQVAEQRNITVYTTYDRDLYNMVVNPALLAQAITTFLSHALEHILEYGALGLEVLGDRRHQSLHIIIWDTSDGALNKKLSLALNTESSETSNSLANAIKIIYSHEGSISLRKTSRENTNLTLSIPWRAHETVEDETIDHSKQGAGRHILLAEDDPFNANTITYYLRTFGFIVGYAENGHQAIDYIHEKHPDLVLMDIHMPKKDGLSAIKEIRQSLDPKIANTPIIALTALSMSSDRQECLDAGANDFISKPVSLRWLSQSIQAHLEKNKG